MKDFKKWEKEKKLIPKMIIIYCRNKHKKKRKSNLLKRNELCEDCKEIEEYALLRLEKCPFKENKQFCIFCKIHCYNPDMREKIKNVMKFVGPRFLLSHPLFTISHAIQVIKQKCERREEKND